MKAVWIREVATDVRGTPMTNSHNLASTIILAHRSYSRCGHSRAVFYTGVARLITGQQFESPVACCGSHCSVSTWPALYTPRHGVTMQPIFCRTYSESALRGGNLEQRSKSGNLVEVIQGCAILRAGLSRDDQTFGPTGGARSPPICFTRDCFGLR